MKVKFCVDNGANIHSCKESIIDLEAVYDITDVEWGNMSDDDKYSLVEEWGNQYIEMYWEEI